MAQSSTVKNRASYADVLASPPEVVAELLNGVLHTSPRPSPRHALALSHLAIEVGGPFGLGRGGPGGWWILDEPELHLQQDVVVPDIAGWRRERMADLPETNYIDLARYAFTLHQALFQWLFTVRLSCTWGRRSHGTYTAI